MKMLHPAGPGSNAGSAVPPFQQEKRSVRIDDWRRLIGAVVDVRQAGRHFRSGLIEAVTSDDAIAWLAQDGPVGRMLIDKKSGHTIWISPMQLQRSLAA
jgi:hypothetical protein